MEHPSQEFDRFPETPVSHQEKWRACGWILLGCVRILSLNHRFEDLAWQFGTREALFPLRCAGHPFASSTMGSARTADEMPEAQLTMEDKWKQITTVSHPTRLQLWAVPSHALHRPAMPNNHHLPTKITVDFASQKHTFRTLCAPFGQGDAVRRERGKSKIAQSCKCAGAPNISARRV
jgi:hypothetical protein